MNSFKKQCIALRRQDFTLPEIVQITGRPKTSVHFHIQNIPLSSHKQALIREQSRLSALKMSEKQRQKNERSIRRFTVWNRNTVLLTAHLLFDGEIHRSKCRYSSRSAALLKRIEGLVKCVCPTARPKFNKNLCTGVTMVAFYNASLGRYLKAKSGKLLVDITSAHKEHKRSFLTAFFDDEGCMDFRPNNNHRKIRGYQKDVEILRIVQKLLADFGIEARYKRPNEVVIVEKENLEKFEREIGFSPGVRINGNRSNSIWKQSLEKREILRRAIQSYKPIGSNGVHRTK